MKRSCEEVAKTILNGAIDIHIHSGPGLIERSLNHVEACQEAILEGLRAVVVKDHHHSTANLNVLIKKYVIKNVKFDFFGSIVLNNSSGGINPLVVETAINYGAKIVWMPTRSAKNHKLELEKLSYKLRSTTPDTKIDLLRDPPITIVNDKGHLIPEIYDICDLISATDVVLATGHISKFETDLLIKLAKSRGVKRIMVDHPEFLLGASIEDMKEYVKSGIYIEHILGLIYTNKLTYEYLYRMIREVGTAYTIVASDLGMINRPKPVKALKEFVIKMLDMGLTYNELKEVLCNNPKTLLGLN